MSALIRQAHRRLHGWAEALVQQAPASGVAVHHQLQGGQFEVGPESSPTGRSMVAVRSAPTRKRQ